MFANTQYKQIPRIVIAGTNSGSGKTTVTMSLMKSLMNHNNQVQGYKVGPDYIDPTFHSHITKRPSRNLDTWMMPENTMREIFQRGSENADISVIEGVMGLFDGQSGDDDKGSTADIAKQLNAPVILVVNAESQARSAAALVHGFKSFDPDLNVCGVIFNKVASQSHYEFLKQAMSSLEGVKFLGYLPRNSEIKLPERHLGLTPAEEQENLHERIDKLAKLFSQYVDLQELKKIANQNAGWREITPTFHISNFNSTPPLSNDDSKIKVAIAKDSAFSFYYQDNLEWMEDRGIELIPVSPIKDHQLPTGISGIYLGGGFPELYADKLMNNIDFKNNLIALYKRGIPILAECGGFMYLTESIIDLNGKEYPMAKIIPGKVKMTPKLKALGYREGRALHSSILLSKDEKIRGHEFRYSEYIPDELNHDFLSAYELSGRRKTVTSGIVKRNLLASYLHFHLGSNPQAGYKWIAHLKKAGKF